MFTPLFTSALFAANQRANQRSANLGLAAHQLAHQVAAHQLFRAYRPAYQVDAYQRRSACFRGNLLGNHVLETPVLLLQPLLHGCLLPLKKARFPW